MRRYTVLEGLHQEAELLLRLLRCEAKLLEHLLLNVSLVDTNRTTAELCTVEDDIVCLRTYGALIGIDHREVLLHRHRERMMHRLVTAELIGPLEHRELGYPEELPCLTVDEIEVCTELETKCTKCAPYGRVLRVGYEHEEVARLAAHLSAECLQLLFGHELREAGLIAAILVDCEVCEPLRAVALHELGVLIDVLTRHLRLALDIQALDHTAILRACGEHAEATVLHHLGDIVEQHLKTHIRLIGAVLVHRVDPWHPHDWKFNVYIAHLLEDVLQQTLIDLDDIIDVHEAKLHIHLGELRLTIGTEVLITVAACELEVAVEAGYHEELLQELRRLRQCVEGAVVHTGRYEEVSCALRGGLDEGRGLDLEEAVLTHEAADQIGDLRSRHDALCKLRTTKVEVTILETGVLVRRDAILNREWWCLGLGKNTQCSGRNLDASCLHILVGILTTGTNDTGHRDYELRTELRCLLKYLGTTLGLLKHDLQKAGTITKVCKDQTTLVSGALNPAHHGDFSVDIGLVKLCTSARSVQTFHRLCHSFYLFMYRLRCRSGQLLLNIILPGALRHRFYLSVITQRVRIASAYCNES